MKVNEYQLQFMFQVLSDSLSISDGGCSPFKFCKDLRIKMCEAILNQQCKDLKDFSEKETSSSPKKVKE